jgi:hypothetical protein
MAWQDELVPTVQVMVGDLDDANRTYSDDRLEQLVALAAKQVSTEGMVFNQTFVGNVADSAITPDPTLDATRDDNFANLVTLKAVCILDQTDARVAANRAILVKDGSSAIDLSKVASTKLRLLEMGWCAVYADAKFEYQSLRTSAVAGAVILTPFRLYAQGAFGGGFPIGDPRGRDSFIY